MRPTVVQVVSAGIVVAAGKYEQLALVRTRVEDPHSRVLRQRVLERIDYFLDVGVKIERASDIGHITDADDAMTSPDGDQIFHIDIRTRVDQLLAQGSVQRDRDNGHPAVHFLDPERDVALTIDGVRQEPAVIDEVVIAEVLPVARVCAPVTKVDDTRILPARTVCGIHLHDAHRALPIADIAHCPEQRRLDRPRLQRSRVQQVDSQSLL